MAKMKIKEARMPRGYNKRKPRKNPSATMERAIELSKGFHGRDVKEIVDVVEREQYASKLAILGTLIELSILTDEGTSVQPIDFKGSNVNVCSSSDRCQIYFIDGDQSLDLSGREFHENELKKQYLSIGPVYSITYFTDKHHLEGPKYQSKGTEYEHEFGEEEDGELPELVYDLLNKKIILVGGSYRVEDEGIKN